MSTKWPILFLPAFAHQLEGENDHSSKYCDQGAAQVCRQGTSQGKNLVAVQSSIGVQ